MTFLAPIRSSELNAQTTCPRMDFMTYSQECPACPTPIPTHTPHPPTIDDCLQAGVCPVPTSPPQPPQDPICLNKTVTEFLADCPSGTASRAGVASCCPADQLIAAGTGSGSPSGSGGASYSSSGLICCVSDPQPTPTPDPQKTPTVCGSGRSVTACAGTDYCCKNPDGICYNGLTDSMQGYTGYEGPYCRPDGVLQWNCSGAFACDPMATPTPTATPANTHLITVQTCSGTYTVRCANDTYILDCVELQGITIPVGGRAGADAGEVGLILSGQVNQSTQSYLNDTQISRGYFMYSVAYALSDVVFTACNVNPNIDTGCQCAYDFGEVLAQTWARSDTVCTDFCQTIGNMLVGYKHPRQYCICTNQPGSTTCPTVMGKVPVRPNNNTPECSADGCLAFDCLLPRVQNGDICPGQMQYFATTGRIATCGNIVRSPSTSASAVCSVPVSSGGKVGQNQDVSICYTKPAY